MKSKSELGKLNVGVPGMQLRKALKGIAENDEFSRLRFDVIHDYCDRLLFRVLAEEMDKTDQSGSKGQTTSADR